MVHVCFNSLSRLSRNNGEEGGEGQEDSEHTKHVTTTAPATVTGDDDSINTEGESTTNSS